MNNDIDNEVSAESAISEEEWAGVYAAALDVDPDEAGEAATAGDADSGEISSAALMADVVQVTADVFAPNWNMQRDESEQLGTVYGALLDKYMPNSGLDKYGLELSALMVTAMFIKSRAGVPLKLKPEKDKEDKKEGEEKSQSESVKVENFETQALSEVL